MPPQSQESSEPNIATLLGRAGISKTIYSLVMPETRAAVDRVLDGADPRRRDGRERFHHMYREAWTQRQDRAHAELFEAWHHWVRPVVDLDPAFAHEYPTAGASEGIKEVIYGYGNRARVEAFEPVLHLLAGEYEGYAAYAEGAGIAVQYHDRGRWRETVDRIDDRHELFLSHPSAIDGNVWSDFEAFCAAVAESAPGCRLHLDLTYVGCTARSFTVPTHFPNLATVLFSLSKPMGVYYHRIGGLLARQPFPGLYGNKWFKNLFSLRLGTELLRRHSVHELPRRYRQRAQLPAVEALRLELGLELSPSDVFLLATAPPGDSELEQALTREAASATLVRCCLTPRLDRILAEAGGA